MLGDGDGEYVHLQILGIHALKKACRRYKIRYSDATRGKVVAAMLAEQLRELGGQEEEEDVWVSLPDSQEEAYEEAVVAVPRPKRVVMSPARGAGE